MRASVAFVQRRVPHYREAFFAGLHDELRERGVALHVIASGPETSDALCAPDRPSWLSALRGRRLTIGAREVIWQDVVHATAAHDLVIIELSSRIISNLAIIARAGLGGPRVGGFGHGRNFASPRIPGPKSAYGRLACSVDWWFAYNDLSSEVIGSYGFPPSRITAINNTIDTRRLAEVVAAHRGAGVAGLRHALGVVGSPVLVFCGSLYAGKRLDFVFDAALRLRQSFPRLNLVVVGDGPCDGEVRAVAEAHDWIHWVGRVVGAERAKYLAAGDVMVMPGMVGLVMLDSFAAGVPLVTTDSPFHGPEIGYLRHAENGWCAPDTIDAYVEAVALLLRDPELLARLERGCAEAAERYSMESMVARFADGVVDALDAPSRLRRAR